MAAERNWVKIAEGLADIAFGANNLAETKAGDKTICLARYKDSLFAFAPRCPHASGFFVNGFLDAMGSVVCPLHRYRFCIKTGRNVSGEGYHLKHWPVEVRDDGVWVGLETARFFGFL